MISAPSARVPIQRGGYARLMADNLNELILYGVTTTGARNIGVGAYARVYEVDYEGTLCAAKEMHPLKLEYAQGQRDELQKIKDNFIKECEIWSTLRHPCIVQFLGLCHVFSLPEPKRGARVVTLIKCVEPFATRIRMKSTDQEVNLYSNQAINRWFKRTLEE